MSLLKIENLKYSYGDYNIYQNAQLDLYTTDHMGIVGPNGSGKSTLIKLCTHQLSPDAGKITWHPRVTIGYLDQYAKINQDSTIYQFLQSAFIKLLKIEQSMLYLYEDVENIENHWDEIIDYQNQLDTADFYHIETEIEKIANGLGLSSIGLDTKISEISGGQRAKVILAKLLLEKPDVLLLDEPTNFLDTNHIHWLAQFLNELEQAFMVISHDYQFLEQISNCICDVDNGELHKYSGKYSDFLKQKVHLQKEYNRRYDSQQRYIKETEEFIRRNIAGIKSKNAQGRRTHLQRLERLAPPNHMQTPPIFDFRLANSGHYQQIITEYLSIGYSFPLFENLDMTINKSEKIVITGFNGIGKSTLLKTLIGHVSPLNGNVLIDESIQIGYYEQDLKWENPTITPLMLMSNKLPLIKEKEIRRKLSRCGLSNQHMDQSIQSLSGGEQAKLKLCVLSLHPYHLLILDEPTNHLDNVSKKALKKALKEFKGSLLLVTHEKDFYQDIINKHIDMTKLSKDK